MELGNMSYLVFEELNKMYIVFFFSRVTLGNLNGFLSTSCVTNLSFLGSQEIGMPYSKLSLNF